MPEAKQHGETQQSRIIGINALLLNCTRQAAEIVNLPKNQQLAAIKELEKKLADLAQNLSVAKFVAEHGEDHERTISC
jgi:hypothetical protein